LIAEGFAHAAGLTVHLKHIRRTIFTLTSAVFWKIALMFSTSAFRARGLRPAGLQIATFASRAACITVQHTGGYVAAGIVTVLLQATVALLARLDESVTTYGTVEEFLRLVPQTVIHAVFKG